MITTDELKVQLADYGTAVKDLEEALAIDASRKRVQELEHTMSRPGFYDDAELSKKVFDEVGDLNPLPPPIFNPYLLLLKDSASGMNSLASRR